MLSASTSWVGPPAPAMTDLARIFPGGRMPPASCHPGSSVTPCPNAALAVVSHLGEFGQWNNRTSCQFDNI